MSATFISYLVSYSLLAIAILIIVILSLVIRSKNRKVINEKIERDRKLRQKRRQIKEEGKDYEKQIINAKTSKQADNIYNHMLNDVMSIFERD